MKIYLIPLFFIFILFLIYFCYCYFSRTNVDALKHVDLYNIIESKTERIDLNEKLSYPIYFINMDKNTTRRNFMENQFEKYNIKNYFRIQGVDIHNFKYNFETSYKLSDKERGCIAGHIITMLEFLNSEYNEAIILEDDVSLILLNHLNFNLNEFIETKVPNDWEIVSLSNLLCNGGDDDKKYDRNIKLYERTTPYESCWSATAYLINKKGAEKLIKTVFRNDTIYINYIKPEFPQYGAADDYLYALVKTYYISPSVCFPYNPEQPEEQNDIINQNMRYYINKGFPKLNHDKFKIIQI